MGRVYPGTAAAGLLKYRRRKDEQRVADALASQGLLFSASTRITPKVAEPKFRRQSFHTSNDFSARLNVPWNKSFDTNSITYQAGASEEVLNANEPLPNGTRLLGRLEVISAPYQREDAAVDHPDLLFFWVAG